MKVYTGVSRKTVGEDHIAICPQFGCEFMTRVKPLKFGFLGFSKHPKCKKHHIPLVYIDERIGDFVNSALACFFDKGGLPPIDLLATVKIKFHEELISFVMGWIYCITVGRGAPIVSRYMDAISNAYLKHLTKKQIKSFKKGNNSKINIVNQSIKKGLNEINNQYTRLLKHLRVHSEIISEHENLNPLSKTLRNYLKEWQENMLKRIEIIFSSEDKHEMTLKDVKWNYDQILNICTCRCFLGLNPESKELKKAKLTAFDRFSSYHEFYNEGLTVKFTKSDVRSLLKTNNEFQKLREKKIQQSELSTYNEEIGEFYNIDIEKKQSLISSREEQNLEINQSRINLQKYIEPILKNYLSKVDNFRKKQLRFGLGYIPKSSPGLMKAYKNRGKCDWVGIIYKITEIIVEHDRKYKGRILYGFTTNTLENRWEWYKNKANDDNIKNQRIHKAILKIQNSGRKPDEAFEREVIEVHFDKILMRQRERYWILKDDTQNPKIGFNKYKGGEGGPIINIQMKFLIKHLALGYGPTQIARIISKNQGFIISKNTVNRRICDYWKSFKRARKNFLKPVLEAMIKDGFRSKEIIRAFGKHGRNIVDKLIPDYFNGRCFLEIKNIYLLEMITKIVPYVSTEEQLFFNLKNFGRIEIVNLINKTWYGFHNAQKQLRRPIVIKLLRENWEGPDIFHFLGYKYSNAYTRHNKFMQKLFGLNTELARDFFNNIYKDLPNEYTQVSNLKPFERIYTQAKLLIKENRNRKYTGSDFVKDLGGLGYGKATIQKNSNRIIKYKFFGMDFKQLKDFILLNVLSPDLANRRHDIEKSFFN